MTRLIIVVDHKEDWAPFYPSSGVLSFDQYLQSSESPSQRVRVINLCRSDRYLSRGYYCSLLAEARGHTVMPSVKTLNDLRRRDLFSLEMPGLEPALLSWLEQTAQASPEDGSSHEAASVDALSFFGKLSPRPADSSEHEAQDSTGHSAMKSLARALFERFPCPILEISFRYRKGWQISAMRPASPVELDDHGQDAFAEALDKFSSVVWRKPRTRRQFRFDLALLVNKDEKLPPSDAKALDSFVKAGKKLGINVETIGRRDAMRIPQFDGLFIRETTAIDHHTYRFARKADAEGMVVIDDPVSILRCTNKVFLADLLKNNRIPTPKTLILSRDQADSAKQAMSQLGFPLVVKIPDGAFSLGVMRAENEAELKAALKSLFRQSALVLAQEYFYTEYDWRIGVLGGRAIYACKYYMVKGHWQIYSHGAEESFDSGDFETMPTYEVPRQVIQAALNATRLIGNGLYGVDIKQAGKRVAVIEVNDNPSIDSGVEDRFLGGELYSLVMQDFLTRMEAKKRLD